MNFQVLVAPNGLAVDVHGPDVGRHNDKFAQLRSLIDQRLGMLFGNRGFTAYGDSIYNVTPFVVTAVAGLMVPVATRSQNRALNRGRIEVEHFFATVTNLFPFLRMRTKHRLLASPVGLARAHRVAFFLTNIHATVYGNQIASRFGIMPPTLESYVKGGVDPAE
jgi:hypothetical protein